MGDADSEIIVPIEEIESWMDEAFEVVDEALNPLFAYITNLNDRTKKIMMKLRSLEYFRNWFMSLNLLIVPVIFSILICYTTRTTMDGTGLEPAFQLIVTFLMFISGSIGVPFYLYSVWESYRRAERLKKEFIARLNQCVPKPENSGQNCMLTSDDSLLTLISREESVERFSELIRFLSERMPEEMRARLERRLHAYFSEPNEESEIQAMKSNNSELQHEPEVNTYSSMHSIDKNNNKALEPAHQNLKIEKSGDCEFESLIQHGMEDQPGNMHFALKEELKNNAVHESKSGEAYPKEESKQANNVASAPSSELHPIWLRYAEENLTKEDFFY